jgi:hypothetical protein
MKTFCAFHQSVLYVPYTTPGVLPVSRLFLIKAFARREYECHTRHPLKLFQAYFHVFNQLIHVLTDRP